MTELPWFPNHIDITDVETAVAQGWGAGRCALLIGEALFREAGEL